MSADWRSRAHCRSVEPETFFPAADEGSPAYEAQVAVAKAVCAGCGVRSDCLEEALARIPYGIAGGLTPEERRSRRAVRASRAAAVLARGLSPDARRAEVTAAGVVLLTAGRPVAEVAAACRVSVRTAERWRTRQHTETSVGGGHRAQAGTEHRTEAEGR